MPSLQVIAGASIPSVGGWMTDDHRYFFNGAGPLPSVTTVLRVLDKPALLYWKAKQTALAAVEWHRSGQLAQLLLENVDEVVAKQLAQVTDQQRDKAGELGTAVHLLADMAARGAQIDSETWQLAPGTEPYLAAFRGFLERYSASAIVSSEKMVWSSAGYAGTYDLLLLIGTELWLIDVKTSKNVYEDYALQLAAYANADAIILPGDPQQYPMPPIQHAGILHLRPDRYPDEGGWRLIEYPIGHRDFVAFLAALELYQWRSERRFRLQ